MLLAGKFEISGCARRRAANQLEEAMTTEAGGLIGLQGKLLLVLSLTFDGFPRFAVCLFLSLARYPQPSVGQCSKRELSNNKSPM
jgi:hypothetical protein